MSQQRSRIDRFFPALLVADLVGLALFAVLAVRSIDQGHQITSNRVQTLRVICSAVNQGREYDRRHEHATVRQTEAEARKLTEAVEGNLSLTAPQRHFASLYLSTVLAIERGTPQALNLNPYSLHNLDCGRLIHGARAAS